MERPWAVEEYRLVPASVRGAKLSADWAVHVQEGTMAAVAVAELVKEMIGVMVREAVAGIDVTATPAWVEKVKVAAVGVVATT